MLITQTGRVDRPLNFDDATPARKMAPKPLILARPHHRTVAAAANPETHPALAPRPPRSRRRSRASDSAAARADDNGAACLWTPPAPERLAHATRSPTIARPCGPAMRPMAGERIAIRSMSVDGEPLLLLADPDKPTTPHRARRRWTCADADEASLASTRMMRAIDGIGGGDRPHPSRFPAQRRPRPRRRAGRCVTGDLCPSLKPLERGFLEGSPSKGRIRRSRCRSPGLWLLHHFADYRWLVDQQASGALDILWVNHTYHHPYARGAPDEHDFLLEARRRRRRGGTRGRAAAHRQRPDAVAVLPLP